MGSLCLLNETSRNNCNVRRAKLLHRVSLQGICAVNSDALQLVLGEFLFDKRWQDNVRTNKMLIHFRFRAIANGHFAFCPHHALGVLGEQKVATTNTQNVTPTRLSSSHCRTRPGGTTIRVALDLPVLTFLLSRAFAAPAKMRAIDTTVFPEPEKKVAALARRQNRPRRYRGRSTNLTNCIAQNTTA